MKEFIRIFVLDDMLKLYHLKDEKYIKRLEALLKNHVEVFSYLHQHISLPIEIVISSNTMFNRIVNLRNLKESDIRTLAKNLLTEKNEAINLVSYEKKFSYRRGFINICDMKLSPVVLTILSNLLHIENPISKISTWPIWIVASYFKTYQVDINKFEFSLFIGEYEKRWEIIAVKNKKIISYRQGNIASFNKKTETENVLKYIKITFDIKLEDIIIYSLNDETIDEFTDMASVNMNLMSNSNEFNDFNQRQNLDTLFKVACSIGFLIAFSSTVFDIFKIFDYKQDIQSNERFLSDIPDKVVEEIPLWNQLKDYNYDHRINIKSEIKKELTNNRKLRNVSINIDEKSNKLTINTVYEHQ